MSLESGFRLGPYEVRSHLGSGGMGEVYLAHDTRLGRDVAIKVLSSRGNEDDASRRRFAREARAISSLSHPNICALYDVGHDDDRDYLVMEYLEGETLAQRIAAGALDPDEAIRIAIDVASALERAHRKGIVHRDLKPGNVMLTKSGAKLLDFGLARLTAGDEASAAGPLTADDALIGTVDYMAPEQIRGEVADARADLFAFGVLLYEMLSGRRPFQGQNRASVIGSILFAAPAPIEADEGIAPSVQRLIGACLEKDPEERLQTAHDLVMQLRWIADGSAGVQPAVPPKRRRILRPATLAAAVLTIAAAAAGVGWSRFHPTAQRTVRFDLTPSAGNRSVDWPVLSPDGKKVVFICEDAKQTRTLWIRDLAADSARLIAHSESAMQPFWSSDGRNVAFFAADKLQTVEVATGRSQILAITTSPRGGTWSRNGTILFTPDVENSIWSTTATGAPPTKVTALNRAQHDLSHRWPEFFPDGEHFVFVIQSTDVARAGLYIAKLGSSLQKKISAITSRAVPTPDGSLLLLRDGHLYRQPFDLDALEFTGAPVAIADVEVDLKVTGAVRVSAASDGSIAFASPGDARSRLTVLDRTGAISRYLTPTDYFVNPELSPDERTVVLSRINPVTGRNSLWLVDTESGAMRAFVDDDANADAPCWSVDGRSILYSSDRRGSYEVYARDVASVGGDRLILASKTFAQCMSDVEGGTLFHVLTGAGGGRFQFKPRGAAAPHALLGVRDAGEASLSPDATLMLVAAARPLDGAYDVYVHPLADPSQQTPISTEGGGQPSWRPDGREIYYIDPAGKLMAIPVDGRSLGTAAALFKVNMSTLFYSTRDYCPTRNGQNFYVLQPDPNARPSRASVILNVKE